MSTSKIPRGDFLNPSPHLANAAANTVVDSLLSSVKQARKRFGLPTLPDYEIARKNLPSLRDSLMGEYTVKRIVEARIRLTVQASLDTHCLTAFPYHEALGKAFYYDSLLAQAKLHDDLQSVIDRFPLIGLVFSVKDCVHVKGLPTTLGCSLRAGHDEAANADIVQHMLDRGAILIAKTTAPQLMMSNTTQSPLWGTTRSPIRTTNEVFNENEDRLDQEFQVGGSSGGEACLVKLGGSQLGIGTDMGGSVRQPACLNELYGYKFASQLGKIRWKLPKDFMTGLPHTTIPATALGFLARDYTTLQYVVKEVYRSSCWNRKGLTQDDNANENSENPQPGAQGLVDTPRIVFTPQKSSPQVQAHISHLVDSLSADEALWRPTKCDELGDVDVKAWGEAWTEHAKEHGFDDARAMLKDDPLIKRTLFDESRLSTNTDKADRAKWKADANKLRELKATFLRQAGIATGTKKTDKDGEGQGEGDVQFENVILITPTYILGGPVLNRSFVELDDAGESEVWCQIFNLLDWPAISVTIPFSYSVDEDVKRKSPPEWARHYTDCIEENYIDRISDDSGGKRPPRLSVQLATIPGNELALLDYVAHIERYLKLTCVRDSRMRSRSQNIVEDDGQPK
ncbi:uncharacterized protein UMAG_06043 [Mycosarcoma maydis]|uniref:Amidase domain-containing protein n=1 Tax=Mycosarcoma maydis TaxID=5270 RepID=A0A0D1DNB5_MYCMD|nr:uncharacterized protein UMAG_06043 [Ustilago maydis 521]KIS65954.1 hypothetical protein UMAG_06043 [Ustilago maydis 521]|eukprot:XP_011392408.1 hypothetical protein UMAG_06043 [Ustilago maydis 521]